MQDAAAFWVFILYASVCSNCTGAGIKEGEEKLIFKLFSVSACWGKLEEP